MAHNLRVPAHFGIRTDKFKLIFFYGCTPTGKNQTPVAWELYDMEKDPFEMRNVYQEPAYQDAVKKLKTQLWELRSELNETDEKFPAIQRIVAAQK